MSTVEREIPPIAALAVDGTSAPVSGRPRGVEERVATLSADRPCAHCGFNLFGQTIVREPHYGLLIARCPECGAPAALQEYPSLARWTGRLTFFAAAAWFAVVLVLCLAASLISWGMAEATTEMVVRPYGTKVDALWRDHATKQGWITQTNPYPTTVTPQQFRDWWEGLPPEKFFAEQGGWGRAPQWSGLAMWLMPLALLVPFGILLATALPKARAGRMAIITLLIVMAASAWAAMSHLSTSTTAWNFGYWGTHYLASLQIGWLPTIMTLVFSALCLFAGMLVGRRIARWLVVLFLPPRLRVAFSYLWTADGKALPSTK